jgi:RNA polymerase sigma factor (sigma-70 family)
MSEPDDQQLLDEFAEKNSEAAFAVLVARYVNLVYSTALRFTGNPHHAEELSQAVFITLARKAGGLQRDTVLSGWLYHTTRLTAANFVKGEIRRQRREQEAFMQSNLTESDAAAWQEIAPLLDDAMGRLGETDRNAVVLRFFQNKTAREVGAALKLTEAAAHKRLSRALEKLRKFFTRRGVTLSTAMIGGAVSANSVHAAPVALAKTITAVALAKSAAASTSTLTLIKGALKVMAWTKTKTAIVTGVVALLGIGTTAVIVESLLSAPDIQGTWIGTIPLAGSGVQAGESPKTRLVMKITKVNGGYQASGDDIDRGIKDVPMSNFSYRHRHIHGEIPASHDVYDGTVNRAGTVVSGKWKEGNASGPLVFKRTTHPPPFPEPLTDAEFAPRAGSVLQGLWKGIIGTGKGGLHITIKIAELADGTYRADFYSMDQGAGRQPTSVSFDGTTVKIMPMAGYGMFQGELRNGDSELVGNWIQGGHRMPTTFTRAN